MVQGSRSFDVTIKTKLGVEFAFSQFMKCVFTRRPVRARTLWTDGADELLRGGGGAREMQGGLRPLHRVLQACEVAGHRSGRIWRTATYMQTCERYDASMLKRHLLGDGTEHVHCQGRKGKSYAEKDESEEDEDDEDEDEEDEDEGLFHAPHFMRVALAAALTTRCACRWVCHPEHRGRRRLRAEGRIRRRGRVS